MDTIIISNMRKIAYLQDRNIYPIGTTKEGDALYQNTKELHNALKNYGIAI